MATGTEKNPVSFLIVCGFCLLLIIIVSSQLVRHRTHLQINNPNMTSRIHVYATARINKVDAISGKASGKVEVTLFPTNGLIKKNENAIPSVEFNVTAKADSKESYSGPLVARTKLFDLSLESPVSSSATGAADFEWQLTDDSSPSSSFPFDRYRLAVSQAHVVLYGNENTVYPLDFLNVEVFDPNLTASSDGWRFSSDIHGERTITLKRPILIRIMFITYVILAMFYLAALTIAGKTDSLLTNIIGLGALFGTREALTRGVTIFPTLVDYVLFLVFLFAGLAITWRVLSEQIKTQRME